MRGHLSLNECFCVISKDIYSNCVPFPTRPMLEMSNAGVWVADSAAAVSQDEDTAAEHGHVCVMVHQDSCRL